MNGIVLTGTVLETEHRAGTFVNDRAESITYDFHVASVLVGTKVVEVKFRNDNPDARPPAQGAVVAIEVELPKGIKPTARRYVESSVEGARKAS